MKKWGILRGDVKGAGAWGLVINVLPTRTLNFALGAGTRCVTVFTRASPWEIYD